MLFEAVGGEEFFELGGGEVGEGGEVPGEVAFLTVVGGAGEAVFVDLVFADGPDEGGAIGFEAVLVGLSGPEVVGVGVGEFGEEVRIALVPEAKGFEVEADAGELDAGFDFDEVGEEFVDEGVVPAAGEVAGEVAPGVEAGAGGFLEFGEGV